MKDDVIKVSFKKNENKLLEDILSECDIIGQSAWMKLAAMEKLKRDKELRTMPQNKNIPIPDSTTTTNQSNQSIIQKPISNKLPIINELTELFKGG